MAIRPITDTLRHIGRGTYLDRVSEELAKVVKHIEEHGGAGAISLHIKVKRANRGGALLITGTHDVKLPKAAADDALMWSTPEGNLQASDPAQSQLEFQVVKDQRPQRTAGD